MRCFQTIPDSDQSISDEEELDQNWPNKRSTLDGSAEEKEKLPLSSRLEMLKGANAYACNLEDDVSPDDEGSNVLSKISGTIGAKTLQKDDVHSIGSDKEGGSYTWSVANKEAEALMRLNEKTSCSSSHSASSKLNRSSKGVKGKGKPKFSFRFPTHKEGSSWLSVSKDENDVSVKIHKLPEGLDAIDYRTEEKSDTELLEDIQGEDENQLEIVPIEVEASKEAEALMRLNEKTSCSSSHSASSKLNRSSNGVKGKPKLSFRFPTHKEGSSWLSVSKDENDVSVKFHDLPERLDAIDYITEDNSDAEFLEDIQGEEENQLEIVPIEVNELGHGCIEHSMAELLDGLQDKTTMLRGSSKMYNRKRRKKTQLVVKRVSSLGDTLIDSESSPERLGPGSPSDSEAGDQNLKLDNPEVKKQTLLDRFHEALSDRALVVMPKPLRIGIFGQLQQVLQSEKESDMEFLKNIETGTNQNEPSCIDVKILSRYLDAKLTVCHCSFGNNLESLPCPESPKNMVSEETTWTVIFNPRVCNDVDLDVGKWIRIHHPWKEVHAGNDKSIILSTYFSEISI